MADRAAELHPLVVAGRDDLTVDDEGGADRDPALGAADAGVGDRRGEVRLMGVGSVGHGP